MVSRVQTTASQLEEPHLLSDDDIDDPLFFKPKQMARILRVSLRTLWRWRSGKRVPEPVKSGNVVRWSRAEVLQWVADGCPGLNESDNGGRRR